MYCRKSIAWGFVVAIVAWIFPGTNVTIAESTLRDHSIKFYEGNLDDIKRFAGQNGKLSFVEFYADWCAPCKWMEETTFTDPALSTFLNTNFISAKVDIDDFDGYASKEEYGIVSLPTMLVFNSRGELVLRIDESLGASKLINLLKPLNTSKNKVQQKHATNVSPSQLAKAPRFHAPVNTRRKYTRPVTSKSYKLEVGTYYDYEKALVRYNKLRETFLEPIIVLNDYEHGNVRYSLLMGDFQTESEATGFQKILRKEFDIISTIK